MSPPVRILMLIALAVAFCLPTLSDKLTRDDYFHWAVLTGAPFAPTIPAQPPLAADQAAQSLFAFLQPGEGNSLEQARAAGLIPWWADERLQVEFWRPLAAFTHWLDYQWWPQSPLAMHWHSAIWHALLIGALAFALVQLGLKGPALTIALLLYTLDASHLVAVGWLANRNILIAAALAFLALAFYHRSAARNHHGQLLVASLLLLASLLSAEGGLAITGFLLAHALFLDQRTWMLKARWLGTMALVVILWRLVYGSLGFAARYSGAYFDPAGDPAPFLINGLVQIPILFMDQLTGIESLQLLMAPHTLTYQAIIGGVFMLLATAIFWPLLRTHAHARFFYAGALLAMVPAGTTLFTGGRLLFISGAGLLVVLSLFLAGLFQRHPWLPIRKAPNVILWIAAIGLLFTTIVANGFIWYTLNKQQAQQASQPVFSNLANVITHHNGEAAHLMVVNPPITFDLMYAQVMAQYHGLQHPDYLRALVPGVAPLVITRTAVNQIEISSETDSLALSPRADFAPVGAPLSVYYGARRADMFFAGSQYQRQHGDHVSLPDIDIRVLEVNGEGIPRRIRFEFARPLEDIAYQWLYWNHTNNAFEPLGLPSIGQHQRLAGPFEQATTTPP